MIKFLYENISTSYLVIDTPLKVQICVDVMFSPTDLLTALNELQLVVILTLFISSAQFSRRNLLFPFIRQRDEFCFLHTIEICLPTDILAYPIDSVANTVNSIKVDKIAKRAKFCIRAAALQKGFVWLVCPIS